jgi:protein involved in polysaccharide export with SLBB domain
MKRSFFISMLFFVFTIFSFGINSYAQNVNPQAMSQVRSLLSSKGLSEAEVIARLKSRGLDVGNMTEADLIKNRSIIEQIVAEMEAEKKAKTQAPASKTEKPIQVVEAVVEKPIVSVKEVQSDTLAKSIDPAAPLPPSDIYGHKIFRDNSIEVYRVSKDANPPESYVLAAGDKINIVIFGKSQADLQYEVNVAGFIQPTNMPKIFLSGLTLKQAKDLLSLRFSTFYFFNKDQFALTLNTSRTLNVNIFGEVEKAGSFTTSALNTALNALSASGGPTNFGTVRNIQIIRGDIKKVLDVYAFMRNPILQFDFYLQNNDIIYVPPAQKIISLAGAVNRPMRYELTVKEGLVELLDYAGGLKTDAFTDFIQLQRYENNIAVIKDYSLRDIISGKIKLELLNGDDITIKSINSELKGFVKVTGAVDYPGNYELSSTKTVKELLLKSKLKPEAKIDQAYIVRKRVDQTNEIISINILDINNGKVDFKLEKEDEIIIYDQARYTDQFSITVIGEVRNPFERNFRFDENLTIEEALGIAGGLKNTALQNGYIYRTSPFDLKKTSYIQIDLNLGKNIKLVPGDKLVILNKDVFDLEATVGIIGDVKNAVNIRYDSSIHVKDLLKLAGGFTISSDITRIDLFRLRFSIDKAPVKEVISISVDKDFNLVGETRNFILNPYDLLVVRKISEFQLNEQIEIKGEVTYPGIYILKGRQVFFSDIISQAKGFTKYADVLNISLLRYQNTPGKIIFNAEQAISHKGNIAFDPILMSGDFIEVPFIINTVDIDVLGTNYILGNEQSSLKINYAGNKSANWYIKEFAGGYISEADKSSLKITRENGVVVITKKYFGFINSYPKVTYGDKISMSLKKEKLKTEKDKKAFDWEKFTNKILALGTSIALITLYSK